MTTTSGLSLHPTTSSFDEVFRKHGYKKVTNGQWIRNDDGVKVYSFGADPTQGWKIFQKQGTNYAMVPGGSGTGSQDLDKFLSENHL